MPIKNGNRRFSLTLGETTYAAIQALAASHGLTMSHVVRKIVDDALEEHPERFTFHSESQPLNERGVRERILAENSEKLAATTGED